MANANTVTRSLKGLGSPARAESSARFFKTAEGEYGHGDTFLGDTVPVQRKIASRYAQTPLPELKKLLESRFHECRLTALFILVGQYLKADAKSRNQIARFYLAHRTRVNNWDLVDSSAPHILGHCLLDKDRSTLYKLARSKSLWDRRIAIIATAVFIKEGEYEDTLKIAEMLLNDEHDLIHKAAGWMLREVGNRSRGTEENFLKRHASGMPRTMLRYAIEKFPEEERKAYMAMRA
jgi:3-methyladenine DNA glycosylase AlkD